MNILKTITLHITGGRPMKDIGCAFIDVVSGKKVHDYIDQFGREWMADNGSWSFFRVRTGSKPEK